MPPPAHQRLDAGDALRRQVELRQELEPEPVVLDRRAQIVQKSALAMVRCLVELTSNQDGVLAASGRQHRILRGLHQPVPVAAAARVDRDADVDLDADLQTRDWKRCSHPFGQRLRFRLRVDGLG